MEIDADGWRVVAEPPVYFRRCGNERPLPEPARAVAPSNGSGASASILDQLTHLVRVGSRRE